jgi:hypothetical protein
MKTCIDATGHDTNSPLMDRRTKYALLIFLFCNFTIAGVSNAAAYLDPGTGSIIFQGIIAVVASGVAVFATAWRSVVRFFNGIFHNSNVEKHSDKK